MGVAVAAKRPETDARLLKLRKRYLHLATMEALSPGTATRGQPLPRKFRGCRDSCILLY